MAKNPSSKTRGKNADSSSESVTELPPAESSDTERPAPTETDTPPEEAEAKPKAVEKSQGPPVRQITAQVWGRGQASPLVRAFVSGHTSKRVVKRAAAEWKSLYKKWLAEPRG